MQLDCPARVENIERATGTENQTKVHQDAGATYCQSNELHNGEWSMCSFNVQYGESVAINGQIPVAWIPYWLLTGTTDCDRELRSTSPATPKTVLHPRITHYLTTGRVEKLLKRSVYGFVQWLRLMAKVGHKKWHHSYVSFGVFKRRHRYNYTTVMFIESHQAEHCCSSSKNFNASCLVFHELLEFLTCHASLRMSCAFAAEGGAPFNICGRIKTGGNSLHMWQSLF